MNRRILLIDSDTTFRTTLTVALQKYRVEIIHEPDVDEAIAMGATEPPVLVVVGVEEPEKAGFKVFQRLKKGPLSKIPIMLATGSVPPESFAKHKGLKTHAEEYVDKRGVSKDELVQRIDALIGLSADAAIEDDLDIPVEVDDIQLGEGAVIDEEAPADDYADQKTRMGGPGIDAGVADDVDDAFAGLMGGDEPALDAIVHQPPKRPSEPIVRTPTTVLLPRATAAPGPGPGDDGSRDFDEMPSTRADMQATVAALRSEVTTSPPPIAAREEISVVDSIPGVIVDGGRRPYDMDDVIGSKDMIAVDDLADATDDEPVAQAPETAPPPASQSQSIALDAIDVEVIEDVEVVEDSGGVPEPVHHPRSADDAAEAVVVQAQAKAESQPIPAASRTQSIDLGLDTVAEDADREQQSGSYPTTSEERDQSGVYDRRALRKIGELERQIAQLKTELERARATAEAAAKGGGREQTFLNLREKMTAAENELKKARGDLGAREREVQELQIRAHGLLEQQRAAETRAAELEQRLAAESAKAAAAGKQEQGLAAKVEGLEVELGEKADAFLATQKARTQLEAELASERALRAASASDAERQLRVEREQLVARHQGELGALRQQLQAREDAALEAQRGELAAHHADALAAAVEAARRQLAAQQQSELAAQQQALQADHEVTLEALRQELEANHANAIAAAIEAARGELGAEAEDAVAQLEAQRDADLAALRGEHEAEVARVTASLEQELARARRDLEGQLATVKSESEALLAQTKTEHESSIAKLRRELLAQVADAHGQRDTANTQHEHALAEATRAHAEELAVQANQHAQAMAARERELATARQDDAIAHTAALAELRTELERAAARHGLDLEGVRREMEELAALHTQTKAEIADEARTAQARLAEQHAAELAKVEADKQRAIEDVSRASADHRAAIERAAEQHRAELAELREAADRELAELRQVLLAAKRQIEETASSAKAAHEQLVQQHEQALAEAKAQHERAMAVANGEIVKVKAVADSEHNRAIAALKAEHDRDRKERESQYEATLREVSTERDELTRGLSAARDTIKRSESELATAVQTIADRNAELRTANAAIGERDGRLAELRKELEAIEAENANYQEQVLRAYQKIKADEAMVARAKKAMAIALTVLDDPATPKSENS